LGPPKNFSGRPQKKKKKKKGDRITRRRWPVLLLERVRSSRSVSLHFSSSSFFFSFFFSFFLVKGQTQWGGDVVEDML
jgi:hypothetical protein